MDEATRARFESVDACLREDSARIAKHDIRLNQMHAAFNACIDRIERRLKLLEKDSTCLTTAGSALLARVEALEAGVVKGATEKPAARVVLPGEPPAPDPREALAAAGRAILDRVDLALQAPQAPLRGLVPVVYDAGRGTRIERTRVTPCPLWAVRCGVSRMSINREWTFEPMPSGRTPEYLAMHSFPSPDAAWAELQLYRETAFPDITPGEGGPDHE